MPESVYRKNEENDSYEKNNNDITDFYNAAEYVR